MLYRGFLWRPIGIRLPFIGSGLECICLFKLSIPNALEIIIKPFFLQIPKPIAGIATERYPSDAVSFAASPLSVIPGSQYNMIPVETIFLFHMTVHQLRSVDIFLIVITANMQLRNFRILNITERRILLPETIIIRMFYKVVPGGNFTVKIFFIYIF